MYEYRRKRRRSGFLMRLLAILLLIVGIPVGLEFLVRALADATGFAEAFEGQGSDEPELTRSYRLSFLSQSGYVFDSDRPNGDLMAVRTPLLGYALQANTNSNYWAINESGFRDIEPISVNKPADEIRIAVLGGSAAFGQLSSNNAATFSEQLEAQLNDRVAQQQANPDSFQPDMLPFFADRVQVVLARPPRIKEGNYRVINAAVPGYASGNELALLAQQILAYQPDVIVVLNGYADLFLPGDLAGADVPGLDDLAIPAEEVNLKEVAASEAKEWFDRLLLVRSFKHYFLQAQQEVEQQQSLQALNVMGVDPDSTLADSLPPDDAELTRRIERYRNHLLQMVRLNSGAGSLMLIGVQPEIMGRNPSAMTIEETAIVQNLGEDYSDRMPQLYRRLMDAANQAAQASANASVVNLSGLYDNFDGQAFQGPTSLTDGANVLLAERIYDRIAEKFVLVPTPFDPRRSSRFR